MIKEDEKEEESATCSCGLPICSRRRTRTLLSRRKKLHKLEESFFAIQKAVQNLQLICEDNASGLESIAKWSQTMYEHVFNQWRTCSSIAKL